MRIRAGSAAAGLAVAASAGQEHGDWRITTQSTPGKPDHQVILRLRGNRTFMSASNLGAGGGRPSPPTIPVLSLGCRVGATLLHIDTGFTDARPRPAVTGAFFRYDGGAEVIPLLQRSHGTFSGEQNELVLRIALQARIWDFIVQEHDVRNVISKMLAHERLEILLNAPGFPLRSVRYDVRGFGEALDSIDDPCGWK